MFGLIAVAANLLILLVRYSDIILSSPTPTGRTASIIVFDLHALYTAFVGCYGVHPWKSGCLQTLVICLIVVFLCTHHGS